MSQDSIQTVDATSQKIDPIKVDSMGGCQRELARIYRMAERGTLDVKVAWRLSQILLAVVKTIELRASDEVLERIERLEQRTST